MNIKITARTPEGAIIDLLGSEVKSGGSTTISLTDEQFAAFTSVCVTHLDSMKRSRAPKKKAKPIGKGKHP